MQVQGALGGARLAPAPPAGARADVPDAAIWVYGANLWSPAEEDAELARGAWASSWTGPPGATGSPSRACCCRIPRWVGSTGGECGWSQMRAAWLSNA